jgi:hypothetical protein
VHPDVQKADNQHTDQGSRRLHGHFQYREKSAQTIWLDGVEYICLKEKQFPPGSCFLASLHKIPYTLRLLCNKMLESKSFGSVIIL